MEWQYEILNVSSLTVNKQYSVRCFSKKFKLDGENFLFFQNITLKVETFAASVYVVITAQDRSSLVIFEKFKRLNFELFRRF